MYKPSIVHHHFPTQSHATSRRQKLPSGESSNRSTARRTLPAGTNQGDLGRPHAPKTNSSVAKQHAREIDHGDSIAAALTTLQRLVEQHLTFEYTAVRIDPSTNVEEMGLLDCDETQSASLAYRRHPYCSESVYTRSGVAAFVIVVVWVRDQHKRSGCLGS
jgi:hypothetical protein